MQLMEMNDDDFIIEVAKRLIGIKSISPFSGGTGEGERADEIIRILKEIGIEKYERFDVEDTDKCKRSNVVVKIGNAEKTLWIIAHIDTVPEGNISLWKKDPFKATVEGRRIYGRGTTDDGQGIFLALLLLKNLRKENLKYNLGVAFVADEELGSKYGISKLMDKNLFKKEDLIYVPDFGASDGMSVEIAEKSILWLKFTVEGRQYHASLPNNAINANRESAKFILLLDKHLHETYNKKDEKYDYPYSSFEPTRHDRNVENINTIPGREVFFFDCRILPEYDLDFVIDDVKRKILEFENQSNVKIKMEIIQKEQAPMPTSENSEAVLKLLQALKKRGGEPKLVGIGGGTCAAFFRKEGYDAVVWSSMVEDVAHQVDEYIEIDNVLKDAETISLIIYGSD